MAARFWVGGTGVWSNTARWSATSGGAGGASVPGTGDTATFNASSGGGTATVDSNVDIQTLTMTGFTGTLAFGTNTITVNNTSGIVFTGATTCSVSGTPVINVTPSGAATSITVTPGAVTAANSISFNFTSGTYTLSFLSSSGNAARNVDFTGFAGTWAARTLNITIYGSLTLSTGMTFNASSGILTFGATSGTQIITTNGKTFDQSITINGIGGTVQLADALTMGATRTLLFTNGTFDGNNKTISGASSFGIGTGSVVVKNVSTTLAFTHTSGTFTQGADNSFGSYSLSTGTLDLASYKLTCTFFDSSTTTARTIAFGTGNITCTSTAGGSLWTTSTTTGLTVTGTPVVNISANTSLASSVTTGPLTEATSMSFNFTTGTYSLTFLNGTSNVAKSVDFTGFGGTWAARTSSGTIYGNLTLSPVAGFSAVSNPASITFGATSGTQIITSNGKSLDVPIFIDGIGGTVKLADAYSMGSTTRAFTLTNGTLDLNGKTLTVGSRFTTAAGTKVLTFNGGTLVCPTANTTSFNNAAPTGFSTLGTGTISLTAATAKTFVGGGSTFTCAVSNGGAGLLTISGNNTIDTVTTASGNIAITGSNTITTISNSVQPVTFTFTASTTQTITNWNVNGTAGNLVTIVSSAAGTAATLSKSSGTVSSNYLSLKDSAATGGAIWYAGANSTNVSGNSGWIFASAPSTSTGNFFLLF